MEKLKHLLDWMPFMIAVDHGGHKVNMTRLFEAAVIAVITAVLVSYIAVEKINVKLDYIQRDLNKMDDRVRALEFKP